MASLIGFARAYASDDSGSVSYSETTYRRGAETLPARVYRPGHHKGPLPGWVVLHGLTRTGREHPGLHRFARSVAASGSLVLVPDIPEWRDLRIAPALTIDTIRAAVRALQQRDDVAHDHAGLLGFSFGATQAQIAATDPDIAPLLHGIAAWGGYSDLSDLCHFSLTGDHAFEGITEHIEPDPYGAWVIAGNYLTAVSGHRTDGAVAEAVLSLALEAGELGVYAWDPVFDSAKDRLRAELRPAQRELFDLLAPLTTIPRRDSQSARELAAALAAAGKATDALLDPAPYLARARVPTLLAHGRDDRLIPYTQTLRMRGMLPNHIVQRCTITGLFSHSGRTVDSIPMATKAVEAVRFATLLRALLNLA